MLRKINIISICICLLLIGYSGFAFGKTPKNASDHEKTNEIAGLDNDLNFQLQKKSEAVLGEYIRALEHEPENEDLYLRVSLEYLKQGERDKAINVLESLCELKPNNSKPYVWLGFMYRTLGESETAIKAYQQAIQLAPWDSDAYEEMASILLLEGKENAAIDTLVEGKNKADEPDQIMRFLSQLYLHKSASTTDEDKAMIYRNSAISVLAQFHEIEPKDETVLLNLSDLYILNNDLTNAITCYEKLKELAPADVNILKKLALVYIASKQERLAIKTLKQVVKIDPRDFKTYYDLGTLYENLEDNEDAIRYYKLATKTDRLPEGNAFFRLAVIYNKINDKKSSYEIIRQGLDVLPEDLPLLLLLTQYQIRDKDHKGATLTARRARKIIVKQAQEGHDISDYAPFFYNYAISALRANFIEDSSQALLDAMSINENYLQNYVVFLFKENDKILKNTSMKVFRHCFEIDTVMPKKTLVRFILFISMIMTDMREYEQALSLFTNMEREAEADPTYKEFFTADFLFYYGFALSNMGDIDGAIEKVNHAIKKDQNHADSYNFLAYLFAEQNIHMDQALKFVHIALQLKPNNVAYLDTLGFILFKLGRLSEALDNVLKAYSGLPDHPDVNEHLGDIFFALGNPKLAEISWKRSLELNPDNIELRTRLEETNILKPAISENEVYNKLYPKNIYDIMQDTKTTEFDFENTLQQQKLINQHY